jgi:hypothetical protein
VPKYTSVDAYIGALPNALREAAICTRNVLDASFRPGAAGIRWAHPTWSIGKEPVCYLKMASPKHLTFGFWKGASIDDPSGRLETSGQVMAHTKLRGVEDVDSVLFRDWIEQAIALASEKRTVGRR